MGLHSHRRWTKRAKRQVETHPYCECPQHKGKRFRADHPGWGGAVADHVIPAKGDPKKFWNGQLQTLTKRCHDSWKKREEMRGPPRYDASGVPVDTEHHWHE